MRMKTFNFDKALAIKYGVDEAIMIWNLQYWIEHNEANASYFHNGRFWTWNTVDAFVKIFEFWSRGQIRRILKSLEDKGVIMTGNYNQRAGDRTMWYAFTDSFLEETDHLLKSTNAFVKTDKCKEDSIYNKQISKQIIKENIPAGGGLFPSETITEPVKVTHPRRTAELSACLFANSRYADFQRFDAEFTAPEFAEIDIAYYYHAVADWSAQKGKKMKDWIATARNFIRSDMERGKLHRLPGSVPSLDPDAMEYLKDMAD